MRPSPACEGVPELLLCVAAEHRRNVMGSEDAAGKHRIPFGLPSLGRPRLASKFQGDAFWATAAVRASSPTAAVLELHADGK